MLPYGVMHRARALARGLQSKRASDELKAKRRKELNALAISNFIAALDEIDRLNAVIVELENESIQDKVQRMVNEAVEEAKSEVYERMMEEERARDWHDRED